MTRAVTARPHLPVDSGRLLTVTPRASRRTGSAPPPHPAPRSCPLRPPSGPPAGSSSSSSRPRPPPPRRGRTAPSGPGTCRSSSAATPTSTTSWATWCPSPRPTWAWTPWTWTVSARRDAVTWCPAFKVAGPRAGQPAAQRPSGSPGQGPAGQARCPLWGFRKARRRAGPVLARRLGAVTGRTEERTS